MKPKWMLMISFAVIGIGLSVLFSRDHSSANEEDQDPVGPIEGKELPQHHLRDIMHRSKELVS
jgi:hypothetical protein